MYTIVVADDEEELRRAIIKRIDWEAVGFRVVGEADNGVEALELVEREEPDLLLTDIRMPFLSGLELARQVREVRPATQIAFLSGYDEFSYAQQAIQYNIISYLLKPITMADLTKELLTMKGRLDHLFEEFQAKQTEHTNLTDFVVPLLLDHYRPDRMGEEQLMVRAEACGLVKNRQFPPSYVVTVLMIHDEQGENRTAPEFVHSMDTVTRKYMSGFHFYSNGKIVSILVDTRTAFRKYLHILAEEMVQSVERILGLKVLMGVSRTRDSLSECHEAYREAVDAMHYSADSTGGVHYIGDEERVSQISMENLASMVSEVENLMRGGEEQELRQYLDQMFEQIRRKGASQSILRFLMVQIVSSVCQIVYAVSDGEEARKLQESAYMQKMMTFDGSLKEAKEYTTDFCMTSRDMITSQRRKSSQVLCEQALQIIDSEYMNPDLSLASVSSRINVSPNYLSTLIKKNEGKTFIDLLTGRRMKEAEQLVLCTPMKMREIADRCGYSDQHYFSYSFKKYMGLSPNALRQKQTEYR